MYELYYFIYRNRCRNFVAEFKHTNSYGHTKDIHYQRRTGIRAF